jgi:hypothetical protein
MTDGQREYAVQEGSDDPQELAAALNAMAQNGFRLDLIYDRFDRLPLLVYSRELSVPIEIIPLEPKRLR